MFDDLAAKDALAVYRFLQGRGYIQKDDVSGTGLNKQATIIPAVPLTGVDMIEPSVPGVLAWQVRPGDVVVQGQVLGEIVDIADPDAPRTPIVSRTSGLVFGMRRHKLARPGDVIIKVAGNEELSWRSGNLLTSR